MLAMEDVINSVAIIATNPYKFVSLSGLISTIWASCLEREREESPNPSNALARKGPTIAAQSSRLPSPQRRASKPLAPHPRITAIGITERCFFLLIISGNLIHH
jgi:hypothetical protein